MLGVGLGGSGCLFLNKPICASFYRKRNIPPREKELLGFMTHLPLQKVYLTQTSFLLVKRSRTSGEVIRCHGALLGLSLYSLLEALIFYYYGPLTLVLSLCHRRLALNFQDCVLCLFDLITVFK